jgi:hypothetical protein
MKEKSRGRWEGFKQLLRYFSLGQYRPPLIYRGMDFYTTTCTGVVTLIFMLAMLVITVILLSITFSGSVKYLDERVVRLKALEDSQENCKDGCHDVTLRDIMKLLGESRNYTIRTAENWRCNDPNEISALLITTFKNKASNIVELDT